MSGKSKAIRVGVMGAGGRGQDFARAATDDVGMRLTALCETSEDLRAAAAKRFGVPVFADFEEFLRQDLDAVIVCNHFHEHAPFAVRALRAGKHVMSETSACFTLAEGVALVNAVEETGLTYMFAENYPYMVFNQEMRRLYQSGAIGEFVYGEGEYVHPGSADFWNGICWGANHWRHWLPATYYSTHSIGPLMYITETWPVKVNAAVMAHPPTDPVTPRRPMRNDAASMIMVRMDNGAVVKLLQVYLRGESIWVRVHGSKGQMENMRTGDPRMVRVRREQYHQRQTAPTEQIYLPNFPERHDLAVHTGHFGGDYFMNYEFARAIRSGKPPILDVYRGVAMSIVGIQAYRSALDDGATIEIPDLRDRAVRRRYAEDDWNPDPKRRHKGMPWPSVSGEIVPSPRALAAARRAWAKVGYKGQ